MMILNSNRRGKRFLAVFADGTRTHFGLDGGSTFIDHGNEDKRRAYLARHRKNENWQNPRTAGALSRWLLWGPSSSIEQNISSFKARFPGV